MREWVLSFPFQLRFLFASRPLITTQVLGLVYRVNFHAFGQESRLLEEDSPHGRGNTDPAVWFRTKPEYSLPYVVPGRGVCRPRQWISSISLNQCSDYPGANSTIADCRLASRTIS